MCSNCKTEAGQSLHIIPTHHILNSHWSDYPLFPNEVFNTASTLQCGQILKIIALDKQHVMALYKHYFKISASIYIVHRLVWIKINCSKYLYAIYCLLFHAIKILYFYMSANFKAIVKSKQTFLVQIFAPTAVYLASPKTHPSSLLSIFPLPPPQLSLKRPLVWGCLRKKEPLWLLLCIPLSSVH